ncbi:MAG: hypothetical protein JSR44_04840 [Spirochaetes bacterium]|nr:hypothetical protein [Spirochaetota bacterium]
MLRALWRLGAAERQQSNAALRTQIRAALLERLSIVIESLWRRSAPAAEIPDLSNFWSQQKLHTFQVAGNEASATLWVPLRGKASLMAELPFAFGRELDESGATNSALSETAYDKRADMGAYDASPSEPLLYSGLVVDARHLPFHASLNTAIFSASGRQIYGVEFLRRATAVKRGVAGFYISAKDSELRQRAGVRPLKISALDIGANGTNENSLVISEEDAAKLTAHTDSVKNLRRARVVVLVSEDKILDRY